MPELVAKLLEELGHDVEEVRPDHDREHLTKCFFTVVSANTAAEIDEAARRFGKKARPADFETATWLGAQIGRSFDGAQTLLAIRDLQAESRRLVHRLRSRGVRARCRLWHRSRDGRGRQPQPNGLRGVE